MFRLGSSRRSFDNQLCIGTLLCIARVGNVRAYFSLMLPSCVYFRKIEQFSSLEGKVQELEKKTSTLLSWYKEVTKTMIDWEKHGVYDG